MLSLAQCGKTATQPREPRGGLQAGDTHCAIQVLACSSTVEHSAVNRTVAGSSPAAPARVNDKPRCYRKLTTRGNVYKVGCGGVKFGENQNETDPANRGRYPAGSPGRTRAAVRAAALVTMSIPKINAYEVAMQYARDVVTKKITAGKLVRLACKRFLRDLKTGTKRGLIFCPDKAQHVVDFFGLLRHSKGEYGGRAFELLSWQVFCVANLFGWYRDNGQRRFREGHIEVGRGNGKSTLMAGVGLYMLVADGEPGADVFSAAVDKDQARMVFDEAVRMRKASPSLAARIGVSGGIKPSNLHVIETNSKFEVMAREDQSQDGLNIHCALVDELHAHRSRDMWDVLAEGARKRTRSLILAITTAGFDRQGICWKQRSFVERILVGGIQEKDGDHVFGYIACIDEGDKDKGIPPDDHFDERNWIKANPSLGVTMKVDDLRKAAIKAKEEPSSLNSFLRKHMNVWTSSEIRLIPPAKWAACNSAGPSVDPRELRANAIKALEGRTAVGGLDLGSTDDLSAFALVFPPIKDRMGRRVRVDETGQPLAKPMVGHAPTCACRACDQVHKKMAMVTEDFVERAGDPRWHVLIWYWCPKETISERVRKARVQYDQWVTMGFIQTTPGEIQDYSFIRAKINELAHQFNIVSIGFDEWGSKQLVTDLRQDGRKVELVRQGFKTLNAPTRALLALIISKKLEHYGDPVLTWMSDNVQADTDAAGNIKPDKAKSQEKIDGIAAIIDSLAEAELIPGISDGSTGSSVYEKRGIVFI